MLRNFLLLVCALEVAFFGATQVDGQAGNCQGVGTTTKNVTKKTTKIVTKETTTFSLKNPLRGTSMKSLKNPLRGTSMKISKS